MGIRWFYKLEEGEYAAIRESERYTPSSLDIGREDAASNQTT